MIDLPTRFISFKPSVILKQRATIYKIVVVIMFLAAGVIRLYHIEGPGALVDREFTSAVFARSFYYDRLDSVTDWERDVALATKNNQPVLEPPVTEYFVSLIYQITGSERLWASHILTGLFWLIGGIFFFGAARMVVSLKAAVIATAYYLFTPLGILLSRSFQPDALMMMLFLMSLYGILKYHERPSLKRVVVVGAVTGLAFLIRPLIFFIIMGAFIGLAIYRTPSWKFFLQRDFLLLVSISLLPAAIYYGNGIFIAGFLRWKVTSSFRPHLYLHQEYWRNWIYLASLGLGLPFLLGGLIGLPILRKGTPRFLVAGMLGGYVIFGLVFTMHIHTHEYYQAQLIPLIGLSVGSLGAVLLNHFQRLDNKWYWWLPVAAAVILVFYFDMTNLRTRLNLPVYESEEVAQQVGELVNHSTRTVFISRYYGMPLQYYGQFSGTAWPKAIEYWLYRTPGERELSIQERLDNLGYDPEYFIITDFNDFNNRHPDLLAYLNENCSIVAEQELYLIYDGNCNQ